jgi:hypothetical protein
LGEAATTYYIKMAEENKEMRVFTQQQWMMVSIVLFALLAVTATYAALQKPLGSFGSEEAAAKVNGVTITKD